MAVISGLFLLTLCVINKVMMATFLILFPFILIINQLSELRLRDLERLTRNVVVAVSFESTLTVRALFYILLYLHLATHALHLFALITALVLAKVFTSSLSFCFPGNSLASFIP
jgi:hypothetical protein